MSVERWHGTTGGYTNHACRCDECRRVWRVYKRGHMRRYRAAQRASLANVRASVTIGEQLSDPRAEGTAGGLAEPSGKGST